MSESPPQALRAEAIESLLIEKGLITADAVDAVIQQYTNKPAFDCFQRADNFVQPEYEYRL